MFPGVETEVVHLKGVAGVAAADGVPLVIESGQWGRQGLQHPGRHWI